MVNREKLVELIVDLSNQVSILKDRAITWRDEKKGTINLTQDQIDQVKTRRIKCLS